MNRLTKGSLVGVLVCGVSGYYVWSVARPTRVADSPILSVDAEVGDRLDRPDGRPWAASPSIAVIIVTSQGCPACVASVPFTERLYTSAKKAGVNVFYVVPARHDLDGQAHALQEQGRRVFRVIPSVFGVSRLPTVLSVDSHGVIRSMWTGTAPAEREAEILDSILLGKGRAVV